MFENTDSTKNIIFLDVDDVLNNMAYMKGKNIGEEIDMRAVARLAKIYKDCDCQIVLSSSWRELRKGQHSLYRYLEDYLQTDGQTSLTAFSSPSMI